MAGDLGDGGKNESLLLERRGRSRLARKDVKAGTELQLLVVGDAELAVETGHAGGNDAVGGGRGASDEGRASDAKERKRRSDELSIL